MANLEKMSIYTSSTILHIFWPRNIITLINEKFWKPIFANQTPTLHLHLFWDAFWKQLGSISDKFWRLAPNDTRTRPHNQSKNSTFFRKPPKRILVSLWLISSDFFGDFLALRAKLRSTLLQDSHQRPKKSQELNLASCLWGFFADLVRFLVHLCVTFYFFLFNFWSGTLVL